ncbi:MAG: DUF4065 domain-containing protein, partial [Gemmataceae bacterium]|nr:DUF4065 domain-containing protein [Gemmataceae bacterium]
MPFDARAVANYFLDKAAGEGRPLDHLALQKLIYVAHGWHLAITNSPLFTNQIQAWANGPVIPDVYHEFKSYGMQPITGRAMHADPTTGKYKPMQLEDFRASPEELAQAKRILDKTWEQYKDFSSLQLSAMTHAPGTPWSGAVQSGVKQVPIPNEEIKQHYVDLTNQR